MSDSLNKIRGWLLFYVILNFIVAAFLVFWKFSNADEVVEAFKLIAGLTGQSMSEAEIAGLKSFIQINNILNIITGVLALVVAITIVIKFKKAILIAKIQLGVTLLVGVLGMILPSILTLPAFAKEHLGGMVGLISAVIWAGLWFAYFLKSKRVQAIFSEK